MRKYEEFSLFPRAGAICELLEIDCHPLGAPVCYSQGSSAKKARSCRITNHDLVANLLGETKWLKETLREHMCMVCKEWTALISTIKLDLNDEDFAAEQVAHVAIKSQPEQQRALSLKFAENTGNSSPEN